MKLSMILALGKNRAIGKDNKMPWYLPADFKYFKNTTMGCPIIMGRKTFQSIGKPLPGRKSVIITRNSEFKFEGCVVVASLHEALECVKDHDNAFIIGGGEIYRQAMPLADEIHITEIQEEFDADTFFPELPTEFIEISRDKNSPDEKNKFFYDFVVYKKQ